MAVPRRCQGVRFYEAGYVNEDESATHFRQIWSVNSKSGGSYVSIPTGNGNAATLTVSATGEADSTEVVTNINFVKYESNDDPAKTIQPWFYLKFPNPQDGPEFTVSASETDVTASDQTNDDGTIFQVFALYSPNYSYVVMESNKLNGNNKLYLSSDGAGKMKLKVWNAPIPGPPHTTDEVDPALLFRMVRPLGQN